MSDGFRKWLITAVGVLLIFCSIGITTATFSVYIPYFVSVKGFSFSQSSILVTVRSVAAFASMFFLTRYFQYFSLRLGITFAMTWSIAAFLILAFFDQYWINCIAVCILGMTYTFASMFPLTLLLNNWFPEGNSIPLSISSSGSGIAAILVPPFVTYITEYFSLPIAFIVDAAFMAFIAALTYLTVQDYPLEKAKLPPEAAKKKAAAPAAYVDIPRWHFYLLMLAVSCNGSLTLAGWGHFAILFKTNGYDSMSIAYALSIGGITLTCSKFFYGFITERLKTFKSNFLFCSLINTGFALSLFLPLHYSWMPTAIAVITGLGCPISTLGVCMWAKEVSKPENFPDNLRKLQTSHIFGGLVMSTVPGVLADLTGSYIPSYVIMFGLGMAAFTIIQSIYWKNGIYKLGQQQ